MMVKASATNAISLHSIISARRGIAFVFFAFILSFSNTYAKDKEFNYLKNGVSFSLPGDWRTISDESLPNKGYYYSAESTGKNTTGLFTLVTINDVENPVKALLVQQKNMTEEPIYKDSGIEFTQIENGKFGSMHAQKVTYEAIVKSTKVTGTIYSFNCAEKTYLIFFQTGIKDKKDNLKVLKLLELTFACR